MTTFPEGNEAKKIILIEISHLTKKTVQLQICYEWNKEKINYKERIKRTVAKNNASQNLRNTLSEKKMKNQKYKLKNWKMNKRLKIKKERKNEKFREKGELKTKTMSEFSKRKRMTKIRRMEKKRREN